MIPCNNFRTQYTNDISQYLGSTAQQKGEAAGLRTYVDDKGLKQQLDFIVHSGDRNPNKYGTNPYADRTNSYDAKAEKTIEQARNYIKK